MYTQFSVQSPPIGNCINLFEVGNVLPACPSDTSSTKIKITVEYWYSDTDMGYSGTLVQ